MIKAAAHLLDEGGVAAVTLRDVGARCGLSHNAPYKHFASKQDLLAAVAARDIGQRRDAVGAGNPDPQAPLERLRDTLQSYVGWALRYPERFKLVFGPWDVPPVAAARRAQSPDLVTGGPGPLAGIVELGMAVLRAHQRLVDAVVAAQDDQALPGGDPERMASLLRAAAHGAVDLALGGHLPAAGEGTTSAADLVDDLLGYLSCPMSRRNRT